MIKVLEERGTEEGGGWREFSFNGTYLDTVIPYPTSKTFSVSSICSGYYHQLHDDLRVFSDQKKEVLVCVGAYLGCGKRLVVRSSQNNGVQYVPCYLPKTYISCT